MPELPSIRHERFARRVAGGATPADAYVEAGYSPRNGTVATSAANRLLTTPDVAARVAEIKAEIEGAAQKAAIVSREWVLARLRENVERAMQAVPVIRDGEPTGEYRYDGAVANRGLELLGKELGMFHERVEATINLDLEDA
ncbi:MAG: terminase small subunit, partial [Alphaproteobacteria bacterium]|nr:terminase small subunit [Alphaproteobacteria bacterium]